MNWIEVTEDTIIPIDKTIIVEDVHGWMGQAYWNHYGWVLETFGQIEREIYFDKIVRYFIVAN
jgi:hypothetical protein